MLPRPGSAPFFFSSLIGFCALFSMGCSGNGASANGCGTHTYTYEDTGPGGYGGADWYDGDYSDGWYDPGDDGSDYSGVGDGSGDDGSSYDDGSGDNGSYDDGTGDGTGDNGSYDDGSGNDGSGDNGSYDDGSGSGGDGTVDDGSGDDGSGDDGTAAHHHLHLTSTNLHTQSSHASCYAYTCTLVCAVDSSTAREARGMSGVSQADACTTAEHGLENWAHDTLGRDVGACKQVANDAAPGSGSSPATPGSRKPASPSVSGGFSSSSNPPMPPHGATSIPR